MVQTSHGARCDAAAFAVFEFRTMSVDAGERLVELLDLNDESVAAGAHRFITNGSADFPRTITEIDVVYPDLLPEP